MIINSRELCTTSFLIFGSLSKQWIKLMFWIEITWFLWLYTYILKKKIDIDFTQTSTSLYVLDFHNSACLWTRKSPPARVYFICFLTQSCVRLSFVEHGYECILLETLCGVSKKKVNFVYIILKQHIIVTFSLGNECVIIIDFR